ncbi:MAG: hypothetical protein KF749_02505 [Bacteroidetes bacterium]|nr:hypothetical protein [Bacteroidota bacterium]MCW5897410.1 hypothetical protein [Bacteroidota bacterium]
MLSKASLIMVMGFGGIVGYIGLNMARNAGTANDNSSIYAEKATSQNLAFTGANIGLANLYQDSLWRGPVTQQVDVNGMAGSFTVHAEEGASGSLVRSISSLRSIAGPMRHDTVEVSFADAEENSFSLYAWMSNNEGNVYWFTGDTVWGALHSNSSLNVSGYPVFMEKVTTAGDIKGDKKNAKFKKGYKTGASRITFPSDLSRLVTAANSGGRYYGQAVEVTLQPGSAAAGDGKAIVRSLSGTTINDTIQISSSGFNGVIGSSQKVNVKGTLDGKLTVFSQQDIWIQDDVTYASGSNYSTSNDLLGLVADKNVIITNNQANALSVKIQASIFCRSGSFYAENYQSRPKGVLQVQGSIVQNDRGAVGTFSGSSLVSGFQKRYTYDQRLANNQVRPPFYPGFFDLRRRIAGWWTGGGGLQGG